MKRIMMLSLALGLGLLTLSLMTSDLTAKADAPTRFEWDTGMVRLGENQRLRLSVTGVHDAGEIYVSFRRMRYVVVSDIYRVASEATTDQIRLMPGQAVSADLDSGIVSHESAHGARAILLSNSRNLGVTAQIVNASTGDIVTLVRADYCGIGSH